MIDISFAFYDIPRDIIRLSSPPCMQVRVSDNMDIYIYTARIRPIGYGLGIRKRKKEILTIVSVRLIHVLSVRKGKKKEQKSKGKKKKLTIIASLSRFYYIVHIITTTLVYSLSLINIVGIVRLIET